VKYLKEGIKEGNPFLSLREFGPFITSNRGHMKIFGETILAFTLQMSSLHRQRSGQENSGTPRRPASAVPSPQSVSGKTDKSTYAQVLAKGLRPTGVTKSTRFASITPIQPSTQQLFTHDTKISLSGQSQVGTEASSASSDPQTLLGQLSWLTISKTSSHTPMTQPQRSSEPAESIERRPRTPQQNQSPSTGNYSKQRERKRK
jgi:hypothetical protein